MQQQDDELLKLKSPTGGFEQPIEPVMANLDCIISELPNGFATFDRQWRYTYVNNRLLEIFKLSRVEVLGKKAWEVFPDQVGIEFFELLNHAMTERIEAQFEFYYELAECWVEHRVYPTTEGLTILMSDISESKRAELTRVAAEQERDRFFDLSVDLLAIANFDGYFLRLNPAWEQTLGFTATELMAQPYLDLVHPDDLATTPAAAQRLSTGQIAIRFENRYRCKDGSYRCLSWSSRPYDERNLVYIVAHDITERKRDEELLRQSEELTRRILESNRDCIKVMDLAGRLIYMNDYGQSLMEVDDFSTVANSQWIEFWQDSDRESARTAFSIALAGEVDRFDGYCTTCKGTPKWWEVIVTPILAADGQVSQILSVSRDITERKIAELNDGFLYELTQRLRHLTDPEEIQWEAVKSLGEYLNVDRATWFEVDLERGLATISRDWDRNGVGSMIGEYLIDEFASPIFQAALLAGKPIAISDVITDPLTAAHSDNYQQVGIRAFASIPCLDDAGRWVMTLHLNTAQNVRIWRDDEIQLLQTLVTQLFSFVAQARAVQALRAQEAQTRSAQVIIGQQLGEIESIYQMAPVGLCFVDTDFRYMRINEQLALINGLSVAEHIGKTFEEVLPELANTMEPVYRQVMESGEPIINLEVTGTNLAQPGVERCWLASFYPQTDDRGRVIGVNNVVQEITERKRQSAALLQSGRKFSAIFNQTFQLMGLVSLDGVLLEVNQAALNSISVSESEIIGKSFWDAPWWHTEQLQQQLRDAISTAASGQFVRYEVEFPNSSGAVSITDFSLKPMFNEVGQVESIVAEAHDITDRKQAQADLEQRNRELDSFVHVVSHDLKAPLRAVANLSEWIEEDFEGSLSVANQQQMAKLRSRVHKMQATINGLLDYARIGMKVETIESVPIAELLADVIDSIAPPPTFKIELPPELPMLSTRRLPLFQVFANLISNGIKHHYSEAGSIQILIEERGDCYEFAIIDDGSGIAPEHHDRMFKIFQAVNPQNRPDSTGIGLAIVKKIIEAEGGTIRLESELGKGTTFYFTWPKVM